METNGGPKLSSIGMKRPMMVSIIALLIDLIGFTVILPLFPSILQHYKENDPSGTYKSFATLSQNFGRLIGAPDGQSESVLMGGLLGSVYCVLQFLTTPIIGHFSDIYGRKTALLLCLVGITVSHCVWFFSASFPVFILSRILGGLSRANVSITTTIVVDDCPNELRPKGMAMIGIAFSIGFVVGPGFGAVFARSGNYHIPALVCIVLSAISFVIVAMFLDETLDRKYRGKSFKVENVIDYLWPPYLFKFKPVSVGEYLSPVGLAYFLYIFIYSGLEFTLTFLTQSKFKYTAWEQGRMFCMLGLAMAIVQGTLTRRLKPDMIESAAMLGMLFMMPAFILLGTCSNEIGLYLGLMCYSVGSGVVGPTLTAVLNSRVTKMNERGAALGIFRSLGALARGFGPLFASSLFWCFGPGVAYIVGAIFLLLPLEALRRSILGAVMIPPNPPSDDDDDDDSNNDVQSSPKKDQ